MMFTYVFGGAIQTALPPAAHGRYVNWLIPGLLAQFALFGSLGAAFRMSEDLAGGAIDRFRSLPMARFALPAGRTLADAAGMLRTMALLLAVGLAIGFRPQTNVPAVLTGIAIALGFGYAWSWAMAALGLVVRTPEAVQAASFMGAFPLAFTSSVFVPTQTMPGNQTSGRRRGIGPAGTAARLLVGALLLGSVVHGHLAHGFHPSSWALGLAGLPALLLALQWLRARRTPTPLESTGPVSHALNLAVFLALYLVEATSDAALIFYGASMLLAALRGYAGCEVLAVSNWLLRRDDQIGCAVFWPVDHLERRAS